MRNQITKHFLSKWAYFDENVHDLTPEEKAKMKILYLSLKELNDEDRHFLAAKYRVAKSELKSYTPYLTDEVLAREKRLTLAAYRNKRVRVENKLRSHIVENNERFKSEYLGHLYANENMKWM